MTHPTRADLLAAKISARLKPTGALLECPILARVVVDIDPEYNRRVYVSKYAISDQAEIAKIVEAVIWGAVDLAQRHGITIKGFEVSGKDG